MFSIKINASNVWSFILLRSLIQKRSIELKALPENKSALPDTHWSKRKTYQIFNDHSKFQWGVKIEGLAFSKWVK